MFRKMLLLSVLTICVPAVTTVGKADALFFKSWKKKLNKKFNKVFRPKARKAQKAPTAKTRVRRTAKKRRKVNRRGRRSWFSGRHSRFNKRRAWLRNRRRSAGSRRGVKKVRRATKRVSSSGTTGPVVPGKTVRPPMAVGFADLHLHQFSDLAFGGRYIWGSHKGDGKNAMRSCSGSSQDGHGWAAGTEGGAANMSTHGKGGWPNFSGWPRWNHTSHQQMHATWLKQAFDSGLKLAVMWAVNQDDFCRMIPKNRKNPRTPCNDYASVKIQIEAAKQFEKQYPWYRIAYSPDDARRIIAEGKMAVILGVEAGNVFEKGSNWRQRLDTLHRMGVRSVHIVHEIDNQFAGAAWHSGVIKILQTIHNLKDWRGKLKQFGNDFLNAFKSKGSFFTEAAGAFKKLSNRIFGFELDENKLNVKGLTGEGQALVREMMRRKMLLEVSHLSQRAVKGVYELAKANRHYPIYASHAHIRELDVYGGKIMEWAYPVELYDMIARTGGMIGLRSNPEDVRTYLDSGVANDCPGSTKSFAQQYQFAVKALGLDVAFAADFNGWAQNLRPRFGSDACAADEYNEKEWPALRARQKNRLGTELDDRGFAHIGLEGDVLRELRNFGVDTGGLERSADTFVRMWQRAYDSNRHAVARNVDLRRAVSRLGPHKKKPNFLARFGMMAKAMFGKIKGLVVAGAKKVVAAAKKVVKKVAAVAKKVVKKVKTGVRKVATKVVKTAKTVVGKVKSGIKKAGSKVKKFFKRW